MTRIERARQNIRLAQFTIGIAAAVGLAAFAAVARASHPGTSQPARSSSVSSRSDTSSEESQSFFGDDSGSNIGPSGSAQPQIQSGGS